MKRYPKKYLGLILILVALGGFTGCRTLMDEDPNSAQLPWATPADWEGTVPGMPARGF